MGADLRMGTLKGRNTSGGWSNASVVWGWNSSGVKTYAKAMFTRKSDNTWDRSWTDCRKLGAEGGRDWTPTTLPAVYSGSCGNRTYQIPTRYSKTGCPSYDVAGATVSSPDCNKDDTNCYNSPVPVTEYRYSCSSRESRTVYVYSPKSGTACGTQYTYSSWVSDPTCEGACTVAKTGNFSSGGIDYFYSGTPGYYDAFPNPNCSPGCDYSTAQYYITTCSGVNSYTLLSSGTCVNALGDPC